METQAPSSPGSTPKSWAEQYRELERRTKHYDALVEVLENITKAYHEELKDQGEDADSPWMDIVAEARAALDAVRLSE